MSDVVVRKCPLCGGEMIKSNKSWHLVFMPPWAGYFSFSGLRNRAYPWACMGCGVVLMYLDNLPVLAADYRKSRDAKAKLGRVPINAVEP
jgi:predicted RNA-binding Zn-ribbon protein involved in translation (DUF1610 family)